jgi:hypothetical protein
MATTIFEAGPSIDDIYTILEKHQPTYQGKCICGAKWGVGHQSIVVHQSFRDTPHVRIDVTGEEVETTPDIFARYKSYAVARRDAVVTVSVNGVAYTANVINLKVERT